MDIYEQWFYDVLESGEFKNVFTLQIMILQLEYLMKQFIKVLYLFQKKMGNEFMILQLFSQKL